MRYFFAIKIVCILKIIVKFPNNIPYSPGQAPPVKACNYAKEILAFSRDKWCTYCMLFQIEYLLRCLETGNSNGQENMTAQANGDFFVFDALKADSGCYRCFDLEGNFLNATLLKVIGMQNIVCTCDLFMWCFLITVYAVSSLVTAPCKS